MATQTLPSVRGFLFDPFWAGILAPADAAGTSATSTSFDAAGLLAKCGGDARACAVMLRKFAARAADQLAALDRAAASQNAIELARQAHTLSEIAANLSANALATWAARLEWQARTSALGRVAPLLDTVRDEVARCLQAVPEVLARIEESDDGPVLPHGRHMAGTGPAFLRGRSVLQ
jgi:HPt (histidine-containing phosphotransfer) domain-containing protein